jgi:AAA15 family ATPase/GTPase
MKADMRNKKFASNVHRENNFNVLKAAGIYGPNNAGKTCLVKCIRSIRDMLLNKQSGVMTNLFSDNLICELGVTFLHDGNKYAYDFKYDTDKNEYVYERFVQIIKDQYANEKEEVWLLRDTQKKEFMCLDKELNTMIPALASNSLIIYLIDSSKFEKMSQMKEIVVSFASKIDIINMNNIPMQKTIDILKNHNDIQRKVVDFIKNADLYLEDYSYHEPAEVKVNTNSEGKPEEQVLDLPENIMEQIRLVSVYRDVPVPSMLFDSTGTKKIAALASYIIEGLENGRIIVVDELDSSIHFKLTRAIVAMFNNELNTNSQLVFTVHDINLMDCKRMFRKEQIWFVHKDEDGVYVYSLAEFTAQNGVRDTTDVIEKYRKGALGALPDPNLINSLIDIKSDSDERDADD